MTVLGIDTKYGKKREFCYEQRKNVRDYRAGKKYPLHDFFSYALQIPTL
jgi:hypothetical protein